MNRESYIVCPRVKNPPLIDGLLKDSVWKEAAKISSFGAVDGRGIKEQSEVYLACNRSHLFLAFVCRESDMGKLKQKGRKSSSKVFFDDNVELFFDTRHDHSSYFRMAISPRGVTCATEGFRKPWDPRAIMKTSLAGDRWIIELSLPLKSLGFNHCPPATIGVNFVRTRWTEKEIEYGSWVPLTGNFHQPARFGDLLWEREVVRVERISYRNCLYRKNLKVEVSILASEKTVLNWELKLTSPGGKTRLSEGKTEVPKRKVLKLTALIREEGLHWLSITLKDRRRKVVFYRATYPVDIPKLITFSLKESSVSYYQETESVPLSFHLNLPHSLLRKMFIRVSLGKDGGKTVNSWLFRNIGRRTFSRTLKTGKLLPGDYTLKAELCQRGGKVSGFCLQTFSKPDSGKEFLFIRGCEADAGEKIHLLALGIGETPEGRTDQERIDWVNSHCGLPIIAHIGMVKTEDLLQLRGFCAIEVYNQSFATLGETEKWDTLLSKGQKVWALAVDDTHIMKRDAGRGWVMARMPLFSVEAALAAIRRGSFYATTGPLIKDLSLKGNSISIETLKRETIVFVADGGKRVKRTVAKKTSYRLKGTEKYLRIEVGKDVERRAWTQPFIVRGRKVYNPYEGKGVWYKGNLHSHTLNSDGEEHPTRVWNWYRKRGYDFLAISDHNFVTG